jgi:hypothetical protein
MGSDDLDKHLAQLQFYFKKNMLDLSVDDVLERVQRDSRVLLSAQASRTQCMNYVDERCEVSHKSIRVRVAREYEEFIYDNIHAVDFYVCNRFWYVNFTQWDYVQTDEPELTDAQISDLLKKHRDQIVWPGQEGYEEYHAQGLARMEEDRRQSEREYLEALKLVGSKQLFSVSKPLHKDSAVISDLIHFYRTRRISLYDPSFGHIMIEDNYHEPIRDPYLDAYDSGEL